MNGILEYIVISNNHFILEKELLAFQHPYILVEVQYPINP